MSAIDERIMECLTEANNQASDKTPGMQWAINLADLCRKLDLELRVKDEKRQLNEMQWSGDYRIGERVRHQDMGDGTVIRSHLEFGEDGPQFIMVIVRFDSHGDIKQLDVDELDIITPRTYLNVYMHDRAWGGPEEGGWHYDTYTPEPEMCLVVREENAEARLVELRKELDEMNRHRRPPSSVCSEGHFVAFLEAWPAEPYPRCRPRYC